MIYSSSNSKSVEIVLDSNFGYNSVTRKPHIDTLINANLIECTIQDIPGRYGRGNNYVIYYASKNRWGIFSTPGWERGFLYTKSSTTNLIKWIERVFTIIDRFIKTKDGRIFKIP